MSLTVEWIEALESGKYAQAYGRLRRGQSFCCLGVYCDLSGLGKWDGDGYFVPDACTTNNGDLPSAARAQLGFVSNDGTFEFRSLPAELQEEICAKINIRFDVDGRTTSLAGLNDCGLTFRDIAKVIRARPKGLFREETSS